MPDPMESQRTTLSMKRVKQLGTVARAAGLAFALSFAAREPIARAEEPTFEQPVARLELASRSSEAPKPAIDTELLPPVPVEMEAKWKGTSGGSYLAPKRDFVTSDGGFDVVFHFHAGMMSERQMRESGLNAVFVSCGYGIGSGPYADAFANPGRFEQMLADVTRNIEKDTGRRGLHVRKLGLASWSAGFAAVGKILGVEKYYAQVDSVVLLDSLHAGYTTGPSKGASQGADKVDLKMIAPFVRFAKDASNGKKAMVITHSAIIPPDYASSTEATSALLTAIGVPTQAVAETNARGMEMNMKADKSGLHVRGFRGAGPKDHFKHLYLVGEVLVSYVVPRWKRDERQVYTLAGEQL